MPGVDRVRGLFPLPLLVAVLATVAALAGLLWEAGEGRTTATSVRGETVELYGEGLYRHDTVFRAAGNRGTDAVTLGLAVPLLLGAAWLARRGSARGRVLLLGALAWFSYVYASLALGTAYNGLFLVYVATFSASLFALVLAFAAVRGEVAVERLPRRALGWFLVAAGVVTAVVWLVPLVASLASGEPPKLLDTATTSVTDALDLAVIVPSALLAGVLVLRGDELGVRIAVPLLALVALLAPAIVLATIFQSAVGIEFTTGEIVGPISGFLVLGTLAVFLLVGVLRAMPARR